MPTAVKGDGVYIIDSQGKRYLDGSGGAAVSCLGHSDPDVIAAIKHQVDAISFAHSGFFTSEPAEELADFLMTRAARGMPGGMPPGGMPGLGGGKKKKKGRSKLGKW